LQVGLSKPLLSRGKFAEIYTETRNANEAEDKLMDDAVEFLYNRFLDKAARSRGMPAEVMEEHAQGRMWLGKDACNKGYVYACTCSCHLTSIGRSMKRIHVFHKKEE
jgi:protease-4